MSHSLPYLTPSTSTSSLSNLTHLHDDLTRSTLLSSTEEWRVNKSHLTLSRRRFLHVCFEQKAELAVQEECLNQIWKEEVGNKRISDLALHETTRELESQRLELCQANQWADQSQREKVIWRIGNQKLFSNKVAQEIAMKLKNHEESLAK